jgi:hypothetical protein
MDDDTQLQIALNLSKEVHQQVNPKAPLTGSALFLLFPLLLVNPFDGPAYQIDRRL